MVHEESDQYRPEALTAAKEEIESRGLEEDDLSGEEDRLEADADEQLGSHRGLLCPTCGSRLRSAMLFGESQMVAIFEDNREQRFIQAVVCPRCGTADLFVDFKTEVED
jgi:hypothetical protein